MLKSALVAGTATALLAALAGCDTNPFAKGPTPVPYPPSQPAFPMNGVLATPAGMTLYTFDKDTTGDASACNGPCAQLWPPFAAPADAAPIGNFTLLKRDDGSQQWAYKGHPVYRYSKDVRAGDKTGDGYKDIWHVAKP